MSKVTKIVASVSKNQLDEREKFANKEKQEWEFELFICIVCTMLCTNMYNDYIIYSHRIVWCMMNELLKHECRFCFQSNDLQGVPQKYEYIFSIVLILEHFQEVEYLKWKLSFWFLVWKRFLTVSQTPG